MMPIMPGRFTADYGSSLIVFVIGLRINHFHKVGQWWPVAQAMPRMIDELTDDKDSGFLGAENLWQPMRTLLHLQYWSDFEHLESYARDRDREHWPAWTAFNKAIGSDGTVGIFHETYAVDAGRLETIYGNMPKWGLGKVAGVVPATGSREQARQRMTAEDVK